MDDDDDGCLSEQSFRSMRSLRSYGSGRRVLDILREGSLEAIPEGSSEALPDSTMNSAERVYRTTDTPQNQKLSPEVTYPWAAETQSNSADDDAAWEQRTLELPTDIATRLFSGFPSKGEGGGESAAHAIRTHCGIVKLQLSGRRLVLNGSASACDVIQREIAGIVSQPPARKNPTPRSSASDPRLISSPGETSADTVERLTFGVRLLTQEVEKCQAETAQLQRALEGEHYARELSEKSAAEWEIRFREKDKIHRTVLEKYEQELREINSEMGRVKTKCLLAEAMTKETLAANASLQKQLLELQQEKYIAEEEAKLLHTQVQALLSSASCGRPSDRSESVSRANQEKETDLNEREHVLPTEVGKYIERLAHQTARTEALARECQDLKQEHNQISKEMGVARSIIYELSKRITNMVASSAVGESAEELSRLRAELLRARQGLTTALDEVSFLGRQEAAAMETARKYQKESSRLQMDRALLAHQMERLEHQVYAWNVQDSPPLGVITE